MKTFYQFLEAIEKHELEDKPDSEIETILEKIKDDQDIVKFTLYCAKDCFQFNNDTTRVAARNCIISVQRWLKNNSSVAKESLHKSIGADSVIGVHIDYNDNTAAAYAAYNAAYHAAMGATNVATSVHINYKDLPPAYAYANNISYYKSISAYHGAISASSAIASFYHANNEDESIRQQKENEYKSYALSLLRSSNLMYKDESGNKEVEKQRNSFTNQFLNTKGKLTNRLDISALLDTLEERGEDLVQQVGNELHLNIPNGIMITAKDKNELEKF
jgi:hypothetical protein